MLPSMWWSSRSWALLHMGLEAGFGCSRLLTCVCVCVGASSPSNHFLFKGFFLGKAAGETSFIPQIEILFDSLQPVCMK